MEKIKTSNGRLGVAAGARERAKGVNGGGGLWERLPRRRELVGDRVITWGWRGRGRSIREIMR